MQTKYRRQVLDAWQSFLETPLDQVLSTNISPDQAVLALFHSVVASVPAYRAFLAEQGVDPAGVREYADFARLPQVTKQGYLRRFPLA